MAFPVAARTTGELITASIWNADIKNNVNALQDGSAPLTKVTLDGGTSDPSVAASGDAVLVYRSDLDQLRLSKSGGAYAELSMNLPALCQGRLSLTTGLNVTSADVTAATTLYWVPMDGAMAAVYSGSAWVLFTLSELSLSLSGFTANKIYDIWLNYNSGTPALDSTVWTNDSTRATALTLQNGILVKSGATTRRYLGSIYINGSGGQTDDAYHKRNVWNLYNQVWRPFLKIDATATWNMNSGTYRYANNDAANRIEFVCGVARHAVEAHACNIFVPDLATYYGICAIGYDANNAVASGCRQATARGKDTSYNDNSFADFRTIPAAGFHYLARLEATSGGQVAFKGTSSFLISGIDGGYLM